MDFAHLPKNVKRVFLQNNKLTGSRVIKKLPQWMEVVDVRGNNFNAIAVVGSKARANIKLQGSAVSSVVDENAYKRDSKQFFE